MACGLVGHDRRYNNSIQIMTQEPDTDDIDYDKLADSVVDQLRNLGVSRRDMLTMAAGGGAATLGILGSGVGSAQDSIDGVIEADQIGTSDTPVQQLYVENQTNFNETESFDAISTKEVNSVQHLSSAARIKDALENASDGDEFKIEPGTYDVNNPITVTANIIVRGAGKKTGTKIRKTNDDLLFFVGDNYSAWFDLEGEGLGKDTGTTDGFRTDETGGSLGRIARIHMENVAMNRMGRDGYHLDSANVSYFSSVRARLNSRYGFKSGGQNANNYTLSAGDFVGNDGSGYQNKGSVGVAILGGYAASNGDHGWEMYSNEVCMYGPGGEANTNETFSFDSGMDELTAVIANGQIDSKPAGLNNVVIAQGGELNIRDFKIRCNPFVVKNESSYGAWQFTHGGGGNDGDLVFKNSGGASPTNFRLDEPSGDFEHSAKDGGGLIVADADGSGDRYRIRVNGGAVEAEGPL